MNRLITWLGLAALVCCVTACTLPYASNDKQQYLSSRNGPDLVIPPPLTRDNISGFYNIPSPEKVGPVSLLPPQLESRS